MLPSDAQYESCLQQFLPKQENTVETFFPEIAFVRISEPIEFSINLFKTASFVTFHALVVWIDAAIINDVTLETERVTEKTFILTDFDFKKKNHLN